METPNNFTQKVIEAVTARTQWYDANIMPKILDNYRLIHTCAKNLYDLMVKKSIIKEDPYRLDQKISGIKAPENTQYAEPDRAHIIGVRFSEYETMLDWICTYYKFSVEQLSISEIKKLLDFNNSFLWASLSPNSNMPNTRGLADMVAEIRRNADALTASSISDILTKCQKATTELTAIFKDLGDYEKEVYKCRIRQDVFMHPKFDEDKAFKSANEEMAQIKKAFPAVFGKQFPFYTQLVEEIIKEDQDANKEKLQEALLKKLEIPKTDSKKKKEKDVDTREMLLLAVQSLCAFATPFQTISSKLNDNNKIIQDFANTGFAKFMAALRKAFNIEEKPVEYEIVIVEKATNTQRKVKINFNPFCADIQKRMAFYGSLNNKAGGTFKKFLTVEEKKIVEFLNKQISDLKTITTNLKGLDTFFKNSTPPEIRSKVKGLSMELTMLTNNIVNTNQYISDYISYIEEQEQLKKLGITEQ